VASLDSVNASQAEEREGGRIKDGRNKGQLCRGRREAGGSWLLCVNALVFCASVFLSCREVYPWKGKEAYGALAYACRSIDRDGSSLLHRHVARACSAMRTLRCLHYRSIIFISHPCTSSSAQELLKTCKFVAFDEEMTGIRLDYTTEPMFGDTVDVRYAKM